MQTKKAFSIIEIMTVVLIVLLLISLTIPIFVNLKMNARTAICQNQMRQIGVLMTSYATSYNGYLPNFSVSDIPPAPGTGMSDNNNLYENWNGHLIPFLDSPIKSFARFAKVFKDGEMHRTNAATPEVDPVDPLTKGWVVIKNSLTRGGYGDLSTFICPEIYSNTYDVKASSDFIGLQIPRIKFSHYLGFIGANYFSAGGTPTTYAANSLFFGHVPYGGGAIPAGVNINSKRLDEISVIGKKVFLIEGGFQNGTTYRSGAATQCYYGGGGATETESLTLSGYGNSFGKDNTAYTGIGFHFLNFVHDNRGPFWTTFGVVGAKTINWSNDVVKRFNEQFKNKAMLVPNSSNTGSGGGYGYDIISYIDPEGGAIFSNFFANPINKGHILWAAFTPHTKFQLYDEPEFHYMVGNMDVLFGDGHVESVGMEWLLNNREEIAKETKE